MRSCLSNPPSAAKGPPAQPTLARRDHPRVLRQPPICRHAPKISYPISHNLSQSLAISRLTLLHLYVPFTFQRIGQIDNSYRLPAARIPLRFPGAHARRPAICAGAAAVNHPHHTNCVNHSSNKCQPALVRALLPEHNPFNPHSRRVTLPPSAIYFSESKETHEFTRQFAPLRANLILTSRTDRITEQGIT